MCLALLLAHPADGTSGSDVLWQIVSQCLEPSVSSYCARCRQPVAGTCGQSADCRSTTEIWAKTSEYVAIRDIKMCGCPLDFVHGLALPRNRVTGVEDPRRPRGIWAFAWEVARSRIADESEIALVVNPASQRTQDQLHVHLVRLAPGARARAAALPAAHTQALDQVWAVAATMAATAKLDDYGVLVMRDPGQRDFVVLAEAASPEQMFTVVSCR